MKKFYLIIAATLAFYVAGAQTAPTWSANVASIMYSKCTGCHHPGAIGPFSLMDYSSAYIQAASMEVSVGSGKMPPWPPDPNYRRFAHERMLTADEKTTILDWIAAGAPEGDPNTAPTPPVYSNQWEIPNPDVSLIIPDYFSEATSNDLYKCFAIPTNITQNKFIKSIEVIPGNRSIVHHVLVFQDNSGDCLALDAASPGPGYTNYGGAGSNNAKLIAGWVPGSAVNGLPNGFGIKLNANSAIVLQIHYPAGTAGMLDSTRVNIKFTDGTTSIREAFVAPILNHQTSMVNGPLYIPANQKKTFEEEFTIPIKATVFSLAPHMHKVGRNFKVYSIPPGEDTIPMINIPEWDFNWQGGYQFQYAQVVNQNSVLRAEALYDNTSSNPFNPHSPPQNVAVGESTDEEMMLVYFTYAYYQPGDENILLDSSLIQTSTPAILPNKLSVNFYPNPAQNSVFIDIPNDNDNYTLTVYSQTGQAILSRRLQEDGWFDISNLPAGVYIADVRNANGIFTQKLVKY